MDNDPGRSVIVTGNKANTPFFVNWLGERITDADYTDDLRNGQCRVVAHILEFASKPPEIVGVAMFNRWTAHSCDANFASDKTRRWCTPQFAFAFYDYVFNHAQRPRINFFLRTTNDAAIKMHKRMGHIYEATMKDAFGEGQDALLYRMTKSEWLAGPWSTPPAVGNFINTGLTKDTVS